MIKEHYAKDVDSKEICHNFLERPSGTYNMQQGFLFHGNKLYIPKIPLRIVLVREVHKRIRGHFGIQKTLDMRAQNFYWPKMLGTVGRFILKTKTCIKAKLTFHKGDFKNSLLLIIVGNTLEWIL